MIKKRNILRKNSLFLLIGVLLSVQILLASSKISVASVSTTQYDYNLNALTPSGPILIENDANFTDYGFLGAGTPGDPYRIEDLNITTSATYGIYVTSTIKNFIIQNCYINAGDYGIYFTGVSFNIATIDNNVIERNTQYGIYIEDSLKVNVTNNKCFYNNLAGIYVDYYADFSRFINNTCKWNDIGIYLFDTFDSYVINNTCSENTFGMVLDSIYGTNVEENTCNDQDYGIIVANTGIMEVKNNICKNLTLEGITLENVNNLYVAFNYLDDVDVSALYIGGSQLNIVTNNTIINSFRGIFIDNTEASNFTYNLIQDNSYYGIHATLLSANNIYHHNSFISNAIGVGLSQAYDLGNFSTWYDVSVNEGNYWDDWVGIGGYNIEGDGEYFVDLYPLSESPMPIISELNRDHSTMFVILLIVTIPSVLLFRKRKR